MSEFWLEFGCIMAAVVLWLIGYGMGFRAASREADRMNAMLAAKARGEGD
jgi:hypothetical protein